MEEIPMKKLALLSMLAILASCAALLTHVQASNKKQPLAARLLDDDESSSCSNETLAGSYGVALNGTRPAPAPPSGVPNYVPGTVEQLIGVDTQTFDGAGNFSQITNEKGSLSGILFPNRLLQGTYTVNSDCSGTITLHIPGLPFSILYDIVIVNHGKEFHGIVASPLGPMVSTTGRKID
jgi:hypothetical protein